MLVPVCSGTRWPKRGDLAADALHTINQPCDVVVKLLVDSPEDICAGFSSSCPVKPRGVPAQIMLAPFRLDESVSLDHACAFCLIQLTRDADTAAIATEGDSDTRNSG